MTLPQYISIRVHYLWSELLKSFKFLSAAGSICWRPSFTCDQDARDVPCWILDIFVDFKQLLTCKKMDIGKSRSNLDQKMKTIPNLKISWKWFNMDPKKWAGMEKADLSANESELVSLETSRRCVHWKRQLWFHQAAYDHQSPLSNYYRLHWLPRGTAEGNGQNKLKSTVQCQCSIMVLSMNWKSVNICCRFERITTKNPLSPSWHWIKPLAWKSTVLPPCPGGVSERAFEKPAKAKGPLLPATTRLGISAMLGQRIEHQFQQI